MNIQLNSKWNPFDSAIFHFTLKIVLNELEVQMQTIKRIS